MPDKVVTYSPAYTLVPTYECFNHCSYCNFRNDPGSPWLTLAQAEKKLRTLQSAPVGEPVIEILVLSGEVHPQSSLRQKWFQHIYSICELALQLGFLPHTNAGPLSFTEMQQLQSVNASMGLMIEQLSPRLMETVHRKAPSKVPALRLQQLEQAGQLRIPFTTGLLLGIGETQSEREKTLLAIARSHKQWGHVQEVILQPYSPGSRETLRASALNHQEFLQTIQMARAILPSDITLQIPPNLLPKPEGLIVYLNSGVRDLGGIGPKDEVNPDYHHSLITELKTVLLQDNWKLVPRLPVYPQYKNWLSEPLKILVEKWQSVILQP